MTTPTPQRWTDDTGTQYVGLTPTEVVLAEADQHMPFCGAPAMTDCRLCMRRVEHFRLILDALAAAGLLREPHTGPRTWQMPNDVEALKDRHGRIWRRGDDGFWWMDAVGDPPGSLLLLTDLLVSLAPLTEVLPDGN